MTELITYFVKENNGLKFTEEQKLYLKAKQHDMKITDTELDVIKADVLF